MCSAATSGSGVAVDSRRRAGGENAARTPGANGALVAKACDRSCSDAWSIGEPLVKLFVRSASGTAPWQRDARGHDLIRFESERNALQANEAL